MMVGKDRDEESGEYRDTYSNEAFINALSDLGGTAGTREVAEQIGCHRDTARRRLTELVEEGTVQRRTVGDSTLWLLADAEHD